MIVMSRILFDTNPSSFISQLKANIENLMELPLIELFDPVA